MYIETMESVLKNAQKIILDDKGKQGVVPYLPLNELNRPKAEAKEPAATGSATKVQGQ
jgi:membrane protease subunit HflK